MKTIEPSNWLLKHDKINWLANCVIEQKKSVEISVKQFDYVIINFACFAKESSGFNGIVNGLIEGFTNPIDSIKGIWGDSKTDREEQQLKTALSKSVKQMEESFNDIEEHLKIAIISAFSNMTSPAIAEMKLFAAQERLRKMEEIEKNKIENKNGEVVLKNSSLNSKIDSKILMSALLIAFVIIIVLLIVLIIK